ncbi:uncharacterized protein LOC130046425 isoform X2 [Ostrea edulis]|uniref:uncharacterized protein LOC130046425 isoform X2 n=1 Tax=Ostrea edulis TaxID=37623 RepID=UPI0024AF8F54|nr:uncharacterized protein LOC130046425 isoform X2 [Ostrea edulis]
MEPDCPSTAEAWNEKSTERACTPKGNYHCMQTQDGKVIELCKNPIWIEAGKCPIYNKAGMLDSTSCVSRPPKPCPSNAYKSNTVFKYLACFPEKSFTRISSTTSRGVNHADQQQNTSTIRTSTHDGGAGPELLALILLIIPVVIGVIVFLQRRGYIKRWRRNINRRRHPENITEESAIPSPTGTNVEDDHGEDQALIRTNDTPNLSVEERRIYVNMANLSFIDKMAKSLLSLNIMVIIGLPGSGKTSLVSETVMFACQKFTTSAHVRHMKDIKELKEITTDQKTFLILDECIKSWFNKNTIATLLKNVENVVEAGKGKIHALICVPATISKHDLEEFLKSSSLQDKIYDLTVDGYTEEDWGAIFDSHKQSRKEWIENQKYEKGGIVKYREAYIQCKAKHIGKATIPSLLFENAYYLTSALKFLENPYDLMLQRINGLSKSNSGSDVRHFAALVILMLHNGKTNIRDINKDMVTELCQVFKVENFSLSHDLQHEDVEQYGDIVSIHCRETVRVTFDVVWKERKDLIIKYCDGELFLERVSLYGVKKVDLLAINDRFQTIISAGTPYVCEHSIWEELRAKCSTFKKQPRF